MKVAVYSRVTDLDQQEDLQLLFDELTRHKIEMVIYRPFFDSLQSCIRFSSKISVFEQSEELDASTDFLISLGGDGTLLDTVTLVTDKSIPVLGINFGRLGFLAS